MSIKSEKIKAANQARLEEMPKIVVKNLTELPEGDPLKTDISHMHHGYDFTVQIDWNPRLLTEEQEDTHILYHHETLLVKKDYRRFERRGSIGAGWDWQPRATSGINYIFHTSSFLNSHSKQISAAIGQLFQAIKTNQNGVTVEPV